LAEGEAEPLFTDLLLKAITILKATRSCIHPQIQHWEKISNIWIQLSIQSWKVQELLVLCNIRELLICLAV